MIRVQGVAGRGTALAMVIGMALAVSACGGQQEQPAPPPPAVEVYTVTQQPVANVIELPGRIQAVRTAEVRARVNGIIEARLYEEGTDVSAGKALFQIDPRELRASLNGAQAQLQRSQATAANAQQVVGRYEQLVPEQAISKQEYDAAVAQLRTAQADVSAARAQLDTARLNLGYSTVTAPISGRASRAAVTEGALVTAANGTLLTTIEQIDRVYVNFSQSSSDVLAVRRDVASGKIKMGNINQVRVTLILEDGSTYPAQGLIDFLDLAIDEQTGTAALRAEVPNPQRVLLPGQFVRARAEIGTRPDGLVVPQRAVRTSPQGASVMVIGPNNVAVVRPVKLGDLQGANWVILGGLKPGEKVITDGLQKVMPDKPVTIVQPGKPGAKPAAAPAPAPAQR